MLYQRIQTNRESNNCSSVNEVIILKTNYYEIINKSALAGSTSNKTLGIKEKKPHQTEAESDRRLLLLFGSHAPSPSSFDKTN